MSLLDLVIALDVESQSKAESTVDALIQGVDKELGAEGTNRIVFKIGLELFTSTGPAIVENIAKRNCRIFLDLKLHDIPETVRKTVRVLAQLPIHFLTIHLQGGEKMVRFALEEAEKFENKNDLQLLGVSVLTSFDQVLWANTQSAYGNTNSSDPSIAAVSAIEVAQSWGLNGFVCSAQDLKAVNNKEKSNCYWMIPGIRPAGGDLGDQARTVTPLIAKSVGASGIVVGRPILNAENPVQVAIDLLRETM